MNMEKIYVVHWANASSDDNGNAKAFCGIHGVYSTLAGAQVALEACKNENYREIVYNPDYDEEDRECAEVNTSVYGSVAEGYFEIDYYAGDTSCELYITITEQ
jgi:hypothetical protein